MVFNKINSYIFSESVFLLLWMILIIIISETYHKTWENTTRTICEIGFLLRLAIPAQYFLGLNWNVLIKKNKYQKHALNIWSETEILSTHSLIRHSWFKSKFRQFLTNPIFFDKVVFLAAYLFTTFQQNASDRLKLVFGWFIFFLLFLKR